MEEKKIITVLLTRYYSTFSNFIYYISGRGYTHASIALDEKNEYFYSFNIKGFQKEYPKKHKQRSEQSISCKLEVSQDDYERIQKKLQDMEQEQERFHYSQLGVLFCLLHIPFHRKNYYFCSQFVAEILSMSKTITLKKDPSLYLPNQLLYELEAQRSLREIICNPI